MSEYKLVIDNRERKILEKIDVEHTVEALDLGDFILKKDDNPYVIIERKTMNDLEASIIDKRFEVQNYRLKKCDIPYKIIIIEGRNKLRRLKYSSLNSIIVSLMLKYDLKVINVDSLEETIEVLKKIKDKANTYFEEIVLDNVKMKTMKKGELMCENKSFQEMLCCIPKVSVKTANILVEEYKTMSNMIYELSDIAYDDRLKTLSNIKIGRKSIGISISENILNYLGLIL